MCGICGIALPRSSTGPVDEAALLRMRDTLEHRGPDDAGIFVDGRIGLGHRRLSIVDLGRGHQPMTNEDGTVTIVYNGEVYNHAQFRSALEASGHVYRSESDTEAIVHLYEEHGPRAVTELRGMFAFAIWDANRRRLVIARDRLGIKPLYYLLTQDGALYFASEIKALLAVAPTSPELNDSALGEYFANRYLSGEETLFRGIKRLLPGHTLVWSDGRVEIEKYWELSYAKAVEPLSDREYVDRFRDLFTESVRLRLMADVPLGVFLSGGIDSSAIAAAMSEMVDEPINTFSVAFAEREANELEFARIVSERYKTRHHEIIVSPEEFWGALPNLVYHEDEPIAHPSSVPLYFVSRLASDHVKVVLTGEGSDELLAGYGKYRKTIANLAAAQRYRTLAPHALRAEIAKTIDRSARGSAFARKLRRTFLALDPDIESIYFDNFSVFSRTMQASLFSPRMLEDQVASSPYASSLAEIERSDAREQLDKLLAADMGTYLHELLMKQDQMSMAASIESRVPFLDHKLVEFSAALPTRMKLRGWRTKHILREAMGSRLPREIITRKKMGFPVPIGAWLRGRFAWILDEYVVGGRALERGIFDADFVRGLVARHKAGEDHAERLWSLVNFEMWQRRFLDGDDARASGPTPSSESLVGAGAGSSASV